MIRSLLIGYKAFSDLLSRLCSFAIVLLAARLLSMQDFGVFSLAWAGGWIVAVASDFGMQILLTREVARNPGRSTPIFLRLLRIRLGLSAILFLAVMMAGRLSDWPSDSPEFFLIVLSQILTSLTEFQNHLFRGLRRSDLESTLNLVHRVGALGLSAVLLVGFGPTLQNLALALLVAAALAAGLAAHFSARLLKATADPVPGGRPVPVSWPQFLPIGIGIVLSALYFRVDVFFIEWFVGTEGVASYSAVFRLVDALRLFPAAVLAVVFPELCRPTGLKIFTFSLLGLLSFSFLLTSGIVWQADRLVALFYGTAYLDSSEAFQVLAFSLPALYINFLLTHQMIGWNLQSSFVSLCAIGLMATLVLNWMLVPVLGGLGAAVACLFREVLLTCIAGIILIRNFPGPRPVPVGPEESEVST